MIAINFKVLNMFFFSTPNSYGLFRSLRGKERTSKREGRKNENVEGIEVFGTREL